MKAGNEAEIDALGNLSLEESFNEDVKTRLGLLILEVNLEVEGDVLHFVVVRKLNVFNCYLHPQFLVNINELACKSHVSTDSEELLVHPTQYVGLTLFLDPNIKFNLNALSNKIRRKNSELFDFL